MRDSKIKVGSLVKVNPEYYRHVSGCYLGIVLSHFSEKYFSEKDKIDYVYPWEVFIQNDSILFSDEELEVICE